MNKSCVVLSLLLLVLAIAGCEKTGKAVTNIVNGYHDELKISNCQELQNINNNLTAKYRLVSDIDCSDTINWNNGLGFTPLGNYTNSFNGIVNGDDHKITGLFINRTTEGFVGLFGYIFNGECYNVHLTESDIHGGYYVGSILGYITDGNISNCSAIGRVRSASYVAGGIGGTIAYSSISNSYFLGSVAGVSNSIGGLTGSNSYGAIINSYAIANVSGSSSVGGLLGYNNGGNVENSYSAGKVIGSNRVGGLIGYSSNYNLITNSFWDKETSGEVFSAGGIGKTSSEMKNIATFINAGWDFDKIWDISSSINEGYPYFSHYSKSETIFNLEIEESYNFINEEIIIKENDGSIQFKSPIAAFGNNLSKVIIFKAKSVEVKTDIAPAFNKPAIITFNTNIADADKPNLKIYKDGLETQVNILSYAPLSFEVDGFSTYSWSVASGITCTITADCDSGYVCCSGLCLPGDCCTYSDCLSGEKCCGNECTLYWEIDHSTSSLLDPAPEVSLLSSGTLTPAQFLKWESLAPAPGKYDICNAKHISDIFRFEPQRDPATGAITNVITDAEKSSISSQVTSWLSSKMGLSSDYELFFDVVYDIDPMTGPIPDSRRIYVGIKKK